MGPSRTSTVDSWHSWTTGIGCIPMKPKKRNPTDKQQLGIRVSNSVIVDTKILAIRQNRRLNEVVEEALEDLLKKYKVRRTLFESHPK